MALEHFRIHYEGPLSAWQPAEIAEAVLDLGGDDDRALALWASTEPFATAELAYPVRYCLRSWLDETTWQSRFADSHLVTDEDRRRLLQFDASQHHVVRFRPRAKPPAFLPWKIRAPEFLRQQARDAPFLLPSPPVPFPFDQPLLDQLALLPFLRNNTPAPHTELEIQASDGKHLRGYRARHLGIELLEPWGKKADHLELLARYDDPDEVGHPFELWIARDPQRTPLRLRVEQPYGKFVVQRIDAAEARIRHADRCTGT